MDEAERLILRAAYDPLPAERLVTDSALRATARSSFPFYVYILCKPDGRPFYVGKGIQFRALHHEAEARTTKRLSHKLNVIRSLQRRGLALSYCIDSFHATEPEAHRRERELIQLIGRHDCRRPEVEPVGFGLWW